GVRRDVAGARQGGRLPQLQGQRDDQRRHHGQPARVQRPGDAQAWEAKVLAVVGTVLVVAAAAIAITGFWKPGFFWVKQLDVAAVQTG
ncbi:hypothetical protein H7H37_18975, partial [Mycolicibacterium insubricum]|nr:hypothetical protein [Mycolicibacterium insubricum]